MTGDPRPPTGDPRPRSGDPRARSSDPRPEDIARGRARVDPFDVPGVTGRAQVPGSLSTPRLTPRQGGDPSPASPSIAFGPQAYPIAEGRAPSRAVAAAKPVQTPVPEDPDPDPEPVRRKRRLLAPLGAALVAALIVGGTYLAAAGGLPRLEPGSGRWGAFSVPSAPTSPSPSATPAVAAPTRLRVKSIDVNTSLERLGLDAKGALRPPKAYKKAGWYEDGTSPGDIGPAVIAGHVDSKNGPAVFYRLRELRKGDRIEVVRGGRTVRFTVTRVRWFPKAEFDTADVYGPTPDRQLRLITCGGVFDRQLRSYRENLVVYAVAG